MACADVTCQPLGNLCCPPRTGQSARTGQMRISCRLATAWFSWKLDLPLQLTVIAGLDAGGGYLRGAHSGSAVFRTRRW